MRGERREKVRRHRQAPRDDLRERTEKVAKVVSHVHVNEMAEQKIDRSDLTAVTWISCFAAAVSFFLAAKAASCLALTLRGGIRTSVLEAPGRSSLARRPENRNPPSRLAGAPRKTGIYF